MRRQAAQFVLHSRGALVEPLESRIMLTALISIAEDGKLTANDTSSQPAVSANGRYVAFASNATNLVSGITDSNGETDIFVRDRHTGTTQLISRIGDRTGNSRSLSPSISDDGRYIAFVSLANDLVTDLDDYNQSADVFLADRVTGAISLVSIAATGKTGTRTVGASLYGAASYSPRISGDGMRVAFVSTADDFGPTITAGSTNIFLRDLAGEVTTRVNALGQHSAGMPAIDHDGSDIAYFLQDDTASLVVTHTTTDTHTTLDLGTDIDEQLLKSEARFIDISADGNWIAFAQPLSQQDNRKLRVWNWQSFESAVLAEKTEQWTSVSISCDGRFVTFDSAVALTDRGDDHNSKVYLFDRHSQNYSLISLDAQYARASYGYSASISGDGRFVVYASSAADQLNMTAKNPAGRDQIYISDNLAGSIMRGRIWLDADGDRLHDTSESPRAGVIVFLDQNRNGLLDSGEQRTTTDSAGRYVFKNLPQGNYTVVQRVSGGLAQSGPAPKSGFSILIRFSSDIPDAVKPIFRAAAKRWSRIIIGDLPDAGGIDDLRINVSRSNLAGDTFAISAPTHLRRDSLLPYRATMTVDPSALASPWLRQIVEHEIAHALGFGALWDQLHLIQRRRSGAAVYTGAKALAQYRNVISASATVIPLETEGSIGTRDVHWKANWSLLDNGSYELLRGYIGGDGARLSVITSAAMQDLGYVVDLGAADHFGFGQILTASDLNQRKLYYTRNAAYAVTIGPAEIRGGYDFSVTQGSSVSGQVYRDDNRDGKRQTNEPLQRRTVYLDLNFNGVLDKTEPRMASVDGSYRFSDLPIGFYRVRQILRDGWVGSGPDYYDLTVEPGENQTGGNFGTRRASDGLAASFSSAVRISACSFPALAPLELFAAEDDSTEAMFA